MICRNCNQEFDDELKTCPHCGERYEDDYFSKMLEHAMGENTRSAEEMDKLRASLKKKKKHRGRNIAVAVVSVILVLAAALSAVYFFVLRGGDDRVLKGGFNGSAFSVYDENGNEIRTVSGGKYTKTEYTPEGAKASSVSYSGFVAFERFDYKDGLLKREYTFDGVKNYSFRSFDYEYDGENPVRAIYESTLADGMTENEYDDYGNLVSVRNYDFESDKKQEYIYDSVGRLTGEKTYDLSGQLIYDKQYSYKSDGTLYLSSVNEAYEKGDGENAVSYILTMLNENGTKAGATINTPEGNELSKVEYSYKDGRLASEKTVDKSGTVLSSIEYSYNDHGNVSCEKIKKGESKSERWYTYEYFDNGAISLKAVAPSEKSKDYSSYITYDKNGRELKNITAVSHFEYKYDGDGRVVEKRSYSPSAKLLDRTEYEYEGDFLKSELLYDAEGGLTSEKTYTADENGNKLLENGTDGTYSYINSYNEQGDLVDTKAYKLTSSEEYEYNEEGCVTKKTVFNELGVFVSSAGYKYFKNGKISDEYTYDSEENVLSHVKYHYDDEGNQDGLTTYNNDGSVSGEATIVNNDKKKEITLENKDSDGNVLYRVQYSYGSSPSLKISGTISGSAYENIYTYDKKGELSSVSYSRDGEVVSEEEYLYNETGNIVKSTSERKGTAQGKSVYEYEYDGLYLKKCTAVYPDGTENTVTYGLDENKKPYLVSGDKQ